MQDKASGKSKKVAFLRKYWFFLPILVLFSSRVYFLLKKEPSVIVVSKSSSEKAHTKRKIANYTLENFEIQSRVKKWLTQARQKYQAGDYASANKVLSKLLKQYPYAGYREEASCLLAHGLFQEGDWDRSEQVIHNLKENSPDPHSPYWACALVLKGQIYEKRGQIDPAIKLYRQVILSFPSDSEWVKQAEELLMHISF